MGYQSRNRNYRTRRQKLEDNLRFWRVLGIFIAIGLVIYAIMERRDIWNWLKTFTY